MGYLKEFQSHVANHDYPAFLRLWEEYCSSDELDPEELKQVLLAVKGSTIAEPFGRHVDKVIPLWAKMTSSPASHECIKLIFDLETTNTEAMAALALDYLKSRYGEQKYYNDKIRLIGLRSKDRFQGAISNYELLTHMERGNHVFHTGGWGVGEIIDVSVVREQLSLEFDYVPGRKDISFETAFKSLIPLPDDHFLALRFGKPDLLEEKAKASPVEVIRMLLRDLGPKTAAEIKDELCELVIPAGEWTRWWQTTRAKVKKDTMIETPEDIRDPFRLRQSEMAHEERLQKALENKPDANTLIQMVYSFVKDFPETLKNNEFKATLRNKLTEMLSFEEIKGAQEIQIHFFLQDLNADKEDQALKELVLKAPSIEALLEEIDILSFKKRLLVEVRKHHADWKKIFLAVIFTLDQGTLRDYVLSELLGAGEEAEVKKKIEELLASPFRHPESFLWYFQKAMTQPKALFADQEGKNLFFESFLVLLSSLEQSDQYRDMIKKMHAILSAGRYAIVRQIMQGASIEACKEFLLLSTKCHSLSDHDIKILHSLAEVVHPALGKIRKKQEAPTAESQVLWTTKEGYQKLQNRIQQIATSETVENAKEIEVARAHGDLRENAEFKAALEKRDRLQSELKFLSEQLNRARILTKDDVATDVVGVGTSVDCKNAEGKKVVYTLLGPWDADPDKGILSFQSKLAQTMKGLKVGEKFSFQDEQYTIAGIRSAI